MATKQQSLRLDYLLQASNNLISQCPTLSRFYMQHYQETLRQNDLHAPRTIDRLSCPRCGQIYLAGYNTSVELVSPSSIRHNDDPTTSKTTTMKKKKKDQKNTVVYTCHACHHRRKFHGSFKRHIPTNSTHPKTAAKADIPCVTNPSAPSTVTLSSNNNKPTSAPTINKKDTMKKDTLPASNKRGIDSPNKQQQQPSKKKSKGSKKNQLQSLLASRKDQNTGGGGGLGLGDFLSSL